MGNNDLRNWPPPRRVLAGAFLTTLGLAYAVALLFVFVQSEMTSRGIARQFRGGEAANAAAGQESFGAYGEDADGQDAVPGLREEWTSRTSGMKFPKSFKDMILTTHLHLLSISTIFFLVGGIFSFSSFPEKVKTPIIASGFGALVLTYACMWGVRYLSGGLAPAVFLFGLVQALSLSVQILWSLRDLLFRRA